jgi:hypothetical protein
MGELASTLEQTVTYVAAVLWQITPKVALKHQQHIATYYYDFMRKLTFRSMIKHDIHTHTAEALSVHILLKRSITVPLTGCEVP